MRAAAILAGATLIVLGGCDAAETANSPAPGIGNVTIAPANTAPLVPTAPVVAHAEQAHRPAVSIDDEGVRLVDPASGATRAIAFGTSRAAVLAALASQGMPELGTNAECPVGTVDFAQFPNGLTLLFQEGGFAGWSLDRTARAMTTMTGIGPGSTRAALDDAHVANVSETTLGTEFTLGGMAGIFDGTGPEARIIAMWAGVSCVAR